MAYAVMDRLTDTDHHRGGGPQPQMVCFAVNHQPFLSSAFQGTDGLADFVVEDFTTASRHLIQTGRLYADANFRDREVRNTRNIPKFLRRKTMAVNLKPFFDAGKQPLVVIDFQIRMNSSLHQDPRTSKRNGLFDLFMDHMVGQNIGFRIAFDAVKGAECTELLTYVCVVD